MRKGAEMEKEEIGKVKKTGFLASAVYLLFGILLIVFPDKMQILVCVILGGVFLAVGIVKLILYFKKDKLEAAMAYDLALGIIFIVIGILILIFRNRVLQLLPVIFGIFLFISSLLKVQKSADIKRLGGSNWWVVLVFSIVSIVFALLLILRPKFIVNTIFMLTGVFMAFDGAGGIAAMAMYAGAHKKAVE